MHIRRHTQQHKPAAVSNHNVIIETLIQQHNKRYRFVSSCICAQMHAQNQVSNYMSTCQTWHFFTSLKQNTKILSHRHKSARVLSVHTKCGKNILTYIHKQRVFDVLLTKMKIISITTGSSLPADLFSGFDDTHPSLVQSIQTLMLDDISPVLYCCQQHIHVSDWTVKRITKGGRREQYSHSLHRWLCKEGMTFSHNAKRPGFIWADTWSPGDIWIAAGKFNYNSFQIVFFCSYLYMTS